MRLTDFLQTDTIEMHLKGTSKEDILRELANILVSAGRIKNAAVIQTALLEREGLGSTGVGHGVAIPHCRCPEVSQPQVAFGRSDGDVDFSSVDGDPARLFFLLVAPENGNNDHLHLLAKIARLMKDPAIRRELLSLDSGEAALALISKRDL